MASQPESWFAKWLRNGRLSGLTFLMVFVTWIGFTIGKLPTETLNTLLLLAGGAFVGNLAIRKEQDEQNLKEKIKELEKKVDNEST